MGRPTTMTRARTVAGGIVAIAVALGGCATPGSVAARSGVAPLPSSPERSGGPAPASSASPAPASSTEIVGLGPPPCPSAEFQTILGPTAIQRPGTDPAVRKPFSDVGVNFGPQFPAATVRWARLDVVVTDAAPIPGDPTGDLSSFNGAEKARPDSFWKLAAGTDPHVARVTLKPFAQGPFVLPAAVLNALPAGVASYTVYLVQSVDESLCFGATPDPSLADSSVGSGYSVIAQLVP
jgi:hypothetical protein